jgi:hypothetical protein
MSFLVTTHAASDRHFRAGRYAALVVYAGALVLAVVLSGPVLFPDSRPVVAAASRGAPRPTGLPNVIPSWAWQLNVWHETKGSARGRRPHGAPTPLPKWYWVWHAWRIQNHQHAQTQHQG